MLVVSRPSVVAELWVLYSRTGLRAVYIFLLLGSCFLAVEIRAALVVDLDLGVGR